MNQITKLLAGTILGNQTAPTDAKMGAAGQRVQEQQIKVCQCGSSEPRFRGYCEDCLKKLKATFDRYLAQFRQVSDEYDQYTGQDQKLADEKLRLMKNKIAQFEIKLSDTEMVDVIAKHEKLAQSEENRAFAEFKASVEALRQELAISKTRHAIELEDLRKQADYLESTKYRKVNQQKDVEIEIEKLKETNLSLKK